MLSFYKKIKLLAPTTLATLCAATFSMQAQAQSTVTPANGFYGAVDGGLTLLESIKSKPSSILGEGKLEHNAGFNFGGAIGYKLDNYRLEGEFRYLRNKVKDTGKDGVPSLHTNNFAYLANAYYDFDQLSFENFRPYAGVGIGYARVTQSLRERGPEGSGKVAIQYDTFAYQVSPGIAYDINSNLSTSIAYKYLGTTKLNSDLSSYQSHSVNLGITYRVGV